MTDYKVSERTQLVTPSVSHKFHISVKGYGYDSQPLSVCMREEDKKREHGGEWTGDK